ncbi:MAG TPA: universal stress protein [Chryseosolibacter sp.]
MKKLLVPMDFSQESINAFRFALDMAGRMEASLLLLNVVPLPVLRNTPFMSMGEYKRHLVRQLSQTAQKRFSKLSSQYNTANIKIETSLVSGRVHNAILECVQKQNIDFIIMGTKGAEGIRELIVGSQTEKIVRYSPVPLMAVKEYHSELSIRNIVFPNMLDTEHQEDLVSKVKELQHLFGATLHLTWVNTPARHRPDAAIRHDLQALADWFMLQDYTINVFNYSDEESGIVEFTRLVDGDLIAMGTHGAKGINHLIRGSLAEDVVNHVRVPVWTYCPKSAARHSTQKTIRWSGKAS